jgi:hypothetical protein
MSMTISPETSTSLAWSEKGEVRIIGNDFNEIIDARRGDPTLDTGAIVLPKIDTIQHMLLKDLSSSSLMELQAEVIKTADYLRLHGLDDEAHVIFELFVERMRQDEKSRVLAIQSLRGVVRPEFTPVFDEAVKDELGGIALRATMIV